jgi:hypothetical protein
LVHGSAYYNLADYNNLSIQLGWLSRLKCLKAEVAAKEANKPLKAEAGRKG